MLHMYRISCSRSVTVLGGVLAGLLYTYVLSDEK